MEKKSTTNKTMTLTQRLVNWHMVVIVDTWLVIVNRSQVKKKKIASWCAEYN